MRTMTGWYLSWSTLVSLLLMLVLSFSAYAFDSTAHVQATLLSDKEAITAGVPFKLGVELEMEPGWHTYYLHSGDAGMPTKIEWQLPEGFKAADLLWEKPHRFDEAGIVTYGYERRTILVSEITPPAKLAIGKSLKFKAKVKWLSCKDVCIPGSQEVEISLPIVLASKVVPSKEASLFEKADYNGPATEIKSDAPKSIIDTNLQITGQLEQDKTGLPLYLLFAFIGGLLLNLMPCVLPVISIKIFSLIEQSGEDPRRIIQHGLTFSLGIILSFLALGGLVIAIQNAGQKIGWGFQFQYPIFVFAMCVVVTVFALSMFGLFYIQVTTGQAQIDRLASSEGLKGTFFKGVLATILSTPCTAPFLGTALGFAFAQPGWLIMTIFFTIALGMAFPYILLTLRPSWMKYLPKPGVWMEKFKESMGFLLSATVVWLLWVLGHQVGIDTAFAVLTFLLCLSFACWLVGGFIDLTSSPARKRFVWVLALIVIGVAYYLFLRPFPALFSLSSPAMVSESTSAKEGISWQPFTIAELDKHIAQNETVFVDFTADWCLTCKANEQTVINTKPVIERFKELKIVPLKADWTTQDPEITKLLQKFGRSGVPLYVIFPAGKANAPIILPELITQPIVLDALSSSRE
ncbi:MAG: thioredoxin family protein [Candidatus Obscuribacterales bacterium]|nr:thioredoxin family protein [Candidatus Obscuribacterales bacterium]